MHHTTNEKADPCKDRPESTTNRRNHNTPRAQGATSEQHRWRPVAVGELVPRVMAQLEIAARGARA